jgi:hypothetical protein
MSARDELIRIIWDGAVADRVKDGLDQRNVPVVRPKVEALADELLAAGYTKTRTITTPAELDALPEGSVIISHIVSGVAYQRSGGQWTRPGRYAPLTPAYFILPATVIHEP